MMTRNGSRFDAAVEMFENNGLTAREAEVYVLRALRDINRHDVADQLEISPSTVDSLFQRAKDKARLPYIERVQRQSATNTGYEEGVAYEIWFENEAMLRYVWNKEDGQIHEQTIRADDPHSIYEDFDVGGSEDEVAEYALESICEYTQSYRDDVSVCRTDWPHIYEAITLHGA